MPSPFLLDVGTSIVPNARTSGAKSSGNPFASDARSKSSTSIFSDHLIDFTKKKQAPAPSKTVESGEETSHAKTKNAAAEEADQGNAKKSEANAKSHKAIKSKKAKKSSHRPQIDDDEDAGEDDAATEEAQAATSELQFGCEQLNDDGDDQTAAAQTDEGGEPVDDATDDDAATAAAAALAASANASAQPANTNPAQAKSTAGAKGANQAIDPTKATGSAAQSASASAARNGNGGAIAENKPAAELLEGDGKTNPNATAQVAGDMTGNVDSEAENTVSADAKPASASLAADKTKPNGSGFLTAGPALKAVNADDSRSASGGHGEGTNDDAKSPSGMIELSDFLDQLVGRDDEKFTDFDAMLDNGASAFKKSVADVANDLMSAAAAASAGVKGTFDPAHPKMVNTPVQVPQSTSPDQQFAVDNHAKIITSVHTASLNNGGVMNIRLDPPELGDMQLSVTMRDGVVNATFETTNERATRMLSHSLNDLKSLLEAAGVTVDKLHVQQAPKNEGSSDRRFGDQHQRQQDNGSQDSSPRREQERREMLQRMWSRLANGSDPLDMVA